MTSKQINSMLRPGLYLFTSFAIGGIIEHILPGLYPFLILFFILLWVSLLLWLVKVKEQEIKAQASFNQWDKTAGPNEWLYDYDEKTKTTRVLTKAEQADSDLKVKTFLEQYYIDNPEQRKGVRLE